jgi:hypothetical protein
MKIKFNAARVFPKSKVLPVLSANVAPEQNYAIAANAEKE